MWTENVTWFSNEAGKKGRIAAGRLADLIVPDRDYLSCPESEIADTVSLLTMVGGKVVHGTGDFAGLAPPLPPAMPDWSPVRSYGGYGAWAGGPAQDAGLSQRVAAACGCDSACGVHGHDHAGSWGSRVPVADLERFWGALGCSCWAV